MLIFKYEYVIYVESVGDLDNDRLEFRGKRVFGFEITRIALVVNAMRRGPKSDNAYRALGNFSALRPSHIPDIA